jgi:two-component system, LuxR family, response regulator FixJ
MPQASATLTAYVVQDDESLARTEGLLHTRAIACRTFTLAEHFLASYDPLKPGCVIADIELPRVSGIELLSELRRRGATHPVILTTAKKEIRTAVEAMHRGAFDCLQKPVESAQLLDTVSRAIAWDETNRRALGRVEIVRDRLVSLTERERTVLELVLRGKSNKAMAGALRVSERMIEVHRSHMMQKMGAQSVAQLVRMLMRLEQWGWYSSGLGTGATLA